jgi:hypothetical protein
MDVGAWDSDSFRRHVDTNLMGMVHGGGKPSCPACGGDEAA